MGFVASMSKVVPCLIPKSIRWMRGKHLQTYGSLKYYASL